MNHNVVDKLQIDKPQQFEPLEQRNLLYVAPIPATPGVIITDEGNSIATSQQGEIRLYGEVVDSTFTILQLRRIAIAGSVIERSSNEVFGLFSIIGPLGQPYIDQPGAGQITELRFQLNYEELSVIGLDETPEQVEQDIYFPPVVQMLGVMTWQQMEKPRPDGVTLVVKLEFFDDVEFNRDRRRNRAQQIFFEQELVLNFIWAGAPRETVTMRRLALLAVRSLNPLECLAPTTDCAPGAALENVRRAPIRFINLSDQITEAESIAIGSRQLQGACEVWRTKAILLFDIPPDVKQGTAAQKTMYKDFFRPRWASFRGDLDLNSVDRVDVCFVNRVFDNAGVLAGGGYTYDARQNSAAIILAVNVAQGNDYLLAHELGHALGLGHPELGAAGAVTTVDNTLQMIVGSPASVMQAGLNSAINSYTNCTIFSSELLNPLATDAMPPQEDCLRADFL